MKLSYNLLFLILFIPIQVFSQFNSEKLIDENYIDSLVSVANQLRNSNPDTVLDLCNQALLLSDSINYKKGKIIAFDQLGVQYKKMGVFDESLKYHFKTLDLIQDSISSMRKAYILNNIANTYTYIHQYKNAEELYLTSLKMKKELKDNKQIAYTLSKLGLLYAEIKKFDLAKEYSEKALNIAEELKDSIQISDVTSHIGFIDLQMKNYEKSIVSLNLSKNIKEKYPHQNYGIAEIETWIAENYLGLKEYSQAKKHLEFGLNLAKKQKSKNQLREIYYVYSDLNKRIGNLKDAFKSLYIADSLNNEIYSDLTLHRIAQYSTIYKLNKNERENRILKEENLVNQFEIDKQTYLRNILIIVLISAIAIIFLMIYNIKMTRNKNRKIEDNHSELEKLNIKLIDANKTKDKFFTIIAHDLKNPLSALLSLGRLLVDELDELKKEEIKDIANSIRSSSLKLNSMLENLLNWARSQRNQIVINIEQVDLDVLIKEVIHELNEMAIAKSIRIDYSNCTNCIVPLDFEMTKIVIRNIINNSIKFTPVGGNISVNIKNNRDSIIIEIKDDGVGIPKNNLENLFKLDAKVTTLGTKKEVGTGLGLILCKEFLNKQGGNIFAFNNEEGGALFRIEVPSESKDYQ